MEILTWSPSKFYFETMSGIDQAKSVYGSEIVDSSGLYLIDQKCQEKKLKTGNHDSTKTSQCVKLHRPNWSLHT